MNAMFYYGKNNKMEEYLGTDYSDNHLRNFCLYWMRAGEGSGDEWRKKNDLDCLYYNGDLRADTLMSAWTPIKWVVECLNADKGLKVYKYCKEPEDKYKYLRELANNPEKYLPSNHDLVKLLNAFLKLAELECNFIHLPDRKMNCERYSTEKNGEKIWLYDEVPSTLYHLFDPDTLGKYFPSQKALEKWVRQEMLGIGFSGAGMYCIRQENVIPLVQGHSLERPQWLTSEADIREALQYMISFLRNRKAHIEDCYRSMYYVIREDR